MLSKCGSRLFSSAIAVVAPPIKSAQHSARFCSRSVDDVRAELVMGRVLQGRVDEETASVLKEFVHAPYRIWFSSGSLFLSG